MRRVRSPERVTRADVDERAAGVRQRRSDETILKSL
jgi:hypothetical protein